jgi:hypothetical protein
VIARIRRLLCLLALAAGLAIAPAATAHADAPAWSSWEAAHSTRCLDVPEASTSNKVQLQQYYCNGSTAQLFSLQPVGNEGFYQIVNYNSGKCLDVRDRSTSENAVVQQYTCHGGTNQWWYPAPDGNYAGHVQFVNRNSWKCLTVQYGSVLANAKLVQNTCNGSGTTAHQAWR